MFHVCCAFRVAISLKLCHMYSGVHLSPSRALESIPSLPHSPPFFFLTFPYFCGWVAVLAQLLSRHLYAVWEHPCAVNCACAHFACRLAQSRLGFNTPATGLFSPFHSSPLPWLPPSPSLSGLHPASIQLYSSSFILPFLSPSSSFSFPRKLRTFAPFLFVFRTIMMFARRTPWLVM